jgi:hypothetical protein
MRKLRMKTSATVDMTAMPAMSPRAKVVLGLESQMLGSDLDEFSIKIVVDNF